jgi:AcrR family transcriptional regulator
MARPRSIADEAILDAAMRLMLHNGPDALTFAAVGKLVGLSPATLVQRFATRERFLQAAMLRGWDLLDAHTAELDRTAEISPEGAIAMVVAMMPPDMNNEETGMGLSVLREDMRDPVLRARGTAWRAVLATALGRRLSDDPERGRHLGLLMASQWQGAQLWWGFERNGDAAGAIARELRDWCAVVLRR